MPDPAIDFAEEFLDAATHPPGFFGMEGVRITFPDLPNKSEVSLIRLEHLIHPRMLGQLLLGEIGADGTPQPLRILLQVEGGDFRGKTKWPATLKLGEDDGRIYVTFGDLSAIWRVPLEEEHELRQPVLEKGASFRGTSGMSYLVGDELGRGAPRWCMWSIPGQPRWLRSACLRVGFHYPNWCLVSSGRSPISRR